MYKEAAYIDLYREGMSFTLVEMDHRPHAIHAERIAVSFPAKQQDGPIHAQVIINEGEQPMKITYKGDFVVIWKDE